MNRNWLLLIGVLLLSVGGLLAQSPSPFALRLTEVNIPDMPGLQSFAWGQADGKWLLIGGRTDGLHRRQPFATFDSLGHNRELVVVDPVSKKVWSSTMNTLPVNLQTQLSATNLQFHQVDATLYLTGGYGMAADGSGHQTHGYLTAVNVRGVIKAIQQERGFGNQFRQIQDTAFAVTGGQLERIGETFYLVGGQNFLGKYNPMGPTHGPGFVQKYNHRILRFDLHDEGGHLHVHHQPSTPDTALLHRRDYNMVPQIMPDGSEGLTAFTGVFQYGVDIPWYHSVDIGPQGHRLITGFQQYYNHYHTARIPLYSAASKEMHTVFFGGIAACYDSLGQLTCNRDVPFVKTVSRVTRDASGHMREYLMPIRMPDYLGASAEFIPVTSLPHYPNGVLKLDSIPDGTVIGHIVGGIHSNDDNVFWVNEGDHSRASTKVFAVYLEMGEGGDVLNVASDHPLQVTALVNPYKTRIEVEYTNPSHGAVEVTVSKGKKAILTANLPDVPAGRQVWGGESKLLGKRGNFVVRVRAAGQELGIRVVVEP